MRKITALILAVIMAAGLLAGCADSSKNTQTTASDDQTAAQQETTTAQIADISQDDGKGTVEKQTTEKSRKSAPGEYFGDQIVIACSSGVNSWDPFSRGGGFGITTILFEGLGVADKEGHFNKLMLKSIEQTDDVTYACEIWDFITDSKGNNITADDVKWSLETYIDAGNSGAVAKFDHLEITGKYTFNWVNKAPFAIGEYEKQLSNFKVLSQKAYESDPDMMANDPVGTAPYKLKEFMEGSYGILEANEDYWFNKIDDEEWLAENDGVWTYQNFKEIRCDVIPDASARAIALEKGSVDACTSMNIQDVKQYVGNPDYTVIDVPVNPPVAFYFNLTENSVCSDVNFRKAVCYAIDSAGVAAGLDVPAFAVFGIQPRMFDSPESWISGEGRDYYNFDRDKAKEYLDKSAYAGETVEVLFTDMDQRQDAWILIQSQLREVGINIQLKSVESAAMQTLKYDFTEWDIMSDTFGGGSYIPNVVKRWSSEDDKTLNGKNCTGVEDAELDALYQNLLNNYSQEAIEEWDQYFTFDNCIGYAVCCFNNQTASSGKYYPVVSGNQYQLTPNAFTPVE